MRNPWILGLRPRALLGCGILLLGLGCAPASEAPPERAAPTFPCDPDNGGIELADGFCATVFADNLGVARHLVVSASGDVYVARLPVRRRDESGAIVVDEPGGLVGLRDADDDGKAEVIEKFGDVAGTGVGLHGDWLYFSSQTDVYRQRLEPGQLVPVGEPEVVVSGFPSQGQHASKPLAFDGAGGMYVTVGAPSNACQQAMRTPGSQGLDPCPQLTLQSGIWRFDADAAAQTQDDGVRYATGIRNAVAIDWNADADTLYAMQHGRDSLAGLFPDLYDAERNAELPAEELQRVEEGDDFGWPYCYYDPFLERRVLAPEYGGDGESAGRCAEIEEPALAFPAHWAPNDLIFYSDGTFPASYEGGAFIAFHGSWNRMPLPQAGYRVVFVPFDGGNPAGDPVDFAQGFPQVAEVRSPGDAVHRPTGLAQGPDGSLYISDSRQGRIWRVRATTEGE